VKTKLLIVLILMICLPLGLLTWLGMRLAKEERSMARAQVRDILQDRLRETDQNVSRYFEQVELELLRITDVANYSTEQLREVVRSEPHVNQLFVLNSEGQLVHPDLNGPINDGEEAFLQRARPFLVDRDLIRIAQIDTDTQQSQSPYTSRAVKGKVANTAASGGPSHGWYIWYWGRGLNLIFWRKLPGGHVVGVELPRLRWMADLLSTLPETAVEQETEVHSRIQLTDSNERVVYQWGSYEPPEKAAPIAEMALSEPLASWRLKYFVAEEGFAALAERSIYFNLIVGLSVAGAGLLALAVYWYRESSRELREAATRVNFVNQVSHELKTPLTNIRMYAELLGRDLAADDDPESKAAQRVKVIMAESSRLSRLIGKVLTFARGQRDSLKLSTQRGVIDDLIASVLESFEPSLRQREIEVDFLAGAGNEVQFDLDAVEQILINLVSNVEKYAADGKRLEIISRQADGETTIQIADQGPGIKERHRSRVFDPFYRVSDRLEGATGAGIGLAIARSLAELHGGSLELMPSDRGAVFKVRLKTPYTTLPAS